MQRAVQRRHGLGNQQWRACGGRLLPVALCSVNDQAFDIVLPHPEAKLRAVYAHVTAEVSERAYSGCRQGSELELYPRNHRVGRIRRSEDDQSVRRAEILCGITELPVTVGSRHHNLLQHSFEKREGP
eukprot:7386484-Prymnesium_polylepis.2